MQLNKKNIILLIMIVFLSSNLLYSAKLIKLGYVDVEAIFAEFPGIEDIRKNLKDERNKYQTEIDLKKAEIAQLEMDLQNNYNNLTEEEKQRRISEIDYKKQLLIEFIDDSNKKLDALREELTKPVYNKIIQVIQKVCIEKGYSFVFKKGSDALLYFDKEYDITKEVIIRLKRELQIQERN